MLTGSRKLVLWICVFGGVLAAYLASVYLAGPGPAAQPASEEELVESEVREPAGELGEVGEARLGQVETARFILPDREWGFDKLLNPEAGGDEWELENPYMKIYRPRFECRVSAKQGLVTVEKTEAGNVSPKEARLSGDVKIVVEPAGQGGPARTVVTLDDVIFDSSRSEFCSAGPVHLVSADAEMVGEGFRGIYDEAAGRLDRFELLELDFLRMRVPREKEEGRRGQREVVGGRDGSGVSQVVSVDNRSGGEGETASAEAVEKATESEEGWRQLYDCVLRENVVVDYGGQMWLSGDEVYIDNILWSGDSGGSEPGAAGGADISDGGAEQAGVTAGTGSQENALRKQEDSGGGEDAVAGQPENEQEMVEIEVTCDGGIVVTPDEGSEPGEAERQTKFVRGVEFTGRPVRVERELWLDETEKSGPTSAQEAKRHRVEVARCARLSYDVQHDIVNLVSGEGADEVWLYGAQSHTELRAERSVRWDRRGGVATVVGPGTMVSQDSVGEPSETGGGPMVASGEEGMEVEFGERMKVAFAGAEQGGGDIGGGIERAELSGGVQARLAGEGAESLRAKQAEVVFGVDQQGRNRAEKMYAEGDVEIVRGAQEEGSGSVFRAEAVDYDVRTGDAIADGKVEFVLYASVEAGQTERIPTVITAERGAKYLAEEGEAVFEGNVIARRAAQGRDWSEESRVRGDRMVAKFARKPDADSSSADDAGREDLQCVTVTGDVVRAESLRKEERGERAVELKCLRLDYDLHQQQAVAAGPGVVKVDNSRLAAETGVAGETFSLDRPGWMLFEGFEYLKWFEKDRRIVAESAGEMPMNIGYLSLTDEGEYGRQINVEAGKIELSYTAGEKGAELDEVLAGGGVHYEEPGVEFAGSELYYDGGRWMKIEGQRGEPCVFNGVFVQKIDYDLTGGDVRAEIAPGIGALEMSSSR